MAKFIDISKRKSNTVKLTEPGEYTVFLFNFTGKVNVEIAGTGINVEILGIYIGRGQSAYQLNTVQHHVKGKSHSDLFVCGVFFDKSRFEYEGLIKIPKDAQQTHAYQRNRNIVMSKDASVESKPFLEIEADDEFCTHGSTTGGIAWDHIYYLQNRGISKQIARKLIIRGAIEEVFEKAHKRGHINVIVPYRKKVDRLLQ